MKKISILISLAATILFFASCSKDEPLPESELMEFLKSHMSVERNKFTLSDLVFEKQEGEKEHLYSWKVKVNSNGTYYTITDDKEFIRKYHLSSTLDRQKEVLKMQSSSSKDELCHHFPKLPERFYKQDTNREKEIEAGGVVKAEYLADKWNLEFVKYDSKVRSKLGKLTRGIETDDLHNGMIMFDTTAAEQLSNNFRNETEKEIARVAALKEEILSHRNELITLGTEQKMITMIYSSKDDKSAQNVPVIIKFTEFKKNDSVFKLEKLRDFEGLTLGSFSGKAKFGKVPSEFRGKVILLKDGKSKWTTKIRNHRKLNLTIELDFDGDKISVDEEFRNASILN